MGGLEHVVTDMLGNPIKEGNFVIYPTRQGSRLDMHLGKVIEIKQGRLKVVRELKGTEVKLTKATWIVNLRNVVRMNEFYIRTERKDIFNKAA